MTEQKILGQFEARKTVQNYSLRQNFIDSEQIKKQNKQLYLHKKISEYRSKYQKTHESHLQNGKKKKDNINKINYEDNYAKKIQSENVWNEMEFLELEKEDQNYTNKLVGILQELGVKPEVLDTDRHTNLEKKLFQKDKNSEYKKPLSQEEKLKLFIFDNIDQKDVNQLYIDYQREKLKDKLNIIKNKENNVDIQQNFLQAKDMPVDPLQEEFLYIQITKPKKFTVGKILNIEEKKIKYKKQNPNMDQFAQQRKEGKLTAQEIMNNLIQEQDKLQEKRVIEMYKETKLEDVEPAGSKKNQYSMMSFKKKNEKQKKMQDNFKGQENNAYLNGLKDPEQEPYKFVRPRNKQYGINKTDKVFTRLTNKKQCNSVKCLSKLSTNATSYYNKSEYNRSIFTPQTTPGNSMMNTPRKILKRPETGRSQISLISRPNSSTFGMMNDHFEQKENYTQTNNSFVKKHKNNMSQIQEGSKDTLGFNTNQVLTPEQQLVRQIRFLRSQGRKLESAKIEENLKNLRQRQRFLQFMGECDEKVTNYEEKQEFDQQMGQLEGDLKKDLDIIENKSQQPKQNTVKDPFFTQFKNEQKFRRGLVNFLQQKVDNTSEIVSIYNDEIWAKKFQKSLINKEQ